MKVKNLLIIILLLFNINVLASNETDITNVKLNGDSITCENLVCSGTVNDTKVKIEYQLVDPEATSTGFKSGEVFEFTSDKLTRKLTVTKEVQGLDTPISSEYVFNITKHLISDDYTLKKLTINGKNIDLKDDVFVYNLEVKYDVSELTLDVAPNSSYAKYHINSDLSFPMEESSKAVDIVVTSEQGTDKEYRIVVKREEIPDATLRLLRISTGEITLEKGVYEYQVNVPYDINKLDLEVKTNSPDATYKVSKNDNDLVVGENKVTITVTNKKIEQEYTLIVTRFENTGEGVVTLSDLKIKEYKDLAFKPANSEYDLYFDKIPLHLTIETETINKENEVVIEGNNNLKDGSVIKIKVLQNRLNMSKEYLLHIHQSNEQEKDYTLYIILIGAALLILIAIIILLIIRHHKKKYNKDKMMKKIKKNLEKNNKNKEKNVEVKEEKKEKVVSKTIDLSKDDNDDSDDDLEII